jgi:hypothetical protein
MLGAGLASQMGAGMDTGLASRTGAQRLMISLVHKMVLGMVQLLEISLAHKMAQMGPWMGTDLANKMDSDLVSKMVLS